jgi:hypothetical protein
MAAAWIGAAFQSRVFSLEHFADEAEFGKVWAS